MSENTNCAFPQQNEKKFIKLLKAQRYYYSMAKKCQICRLIVSMVIPVLFVIAKLKKFDISWIVFLSLVWIPVSFLLRIFEKRYISLGASIQEEFDTKLFQIDKNTICFSREPTIEEVNKGAKRFKGIVEELRDWYPVKDSGERFLNIFIAQRTNIVWDRKLKTRYRNLLIGLIIILIFVEIFIALYLNLSFKEGVSVLFLSSFPLYFLLVEYVYELHKQIKSNSIVDKQILDICENINQFSETELQFKCRQVQDYIYEKNRLKSILIPERLYWLGREKDNQDILEVNNELIEKYKRNLKVGNNQ